MAQGGVNGVVVVVVVVAPSPRCGCAWGDGGGGQRRGRREGVTSGGVGVVIHSVA